jgi:hypothetical protein
MRTFHRCSGEIAYFFFCTSQYFFEFVLSPLFYRVKGLLFANVVKRTWNTKENPPENQGENGIWVFWAVETLIGFRLRPIGVDSC